MKTVILINKKNIIIFFIVIMISLYAYYLDNISTTNTTSSKINFIVTVDAGHGGIDTGTHYNSIYEKDINLAVSKFLVEELKKANIKTIMTRKDDSLYNNSRADDLKYRPNFANENDSDLFISIHVNHFPVGNAKGIQVFYKQNSNKSKNLAKEIDKQISELDILRKRDLKKGDYYVLNNVKSPAVLIECGFLSNEYDRKILTEEKNQKIIAKKITEGIKYYLQDNLGKNNNESKKNNNNNEKFTLNENNYKIFKLKSENENLILKKSNFIYPIGSFLNEEIYQLSENEFTAIYALKQLSNHNEIFPFKLNLNKNNVIEKNDKLYINLDSNLIANFNGGCNYEQKLIESIYNTLYSTTTVKDIIITIDGERNSTIGGHIILP
ncbi:MAG: N-acetylmuramoyl-L-alanine amidase [Bacillota bacterium]